MKLMIVDDNESMRKMIMQMFIEDAEEIIECADGGEAVELYKVKNPDYVLMDIEMKDMDGLTATKKIIEFDKDAKVIIVTDYDKPTFRKAAAQAGAAGFVSKDNLFKIKEFFINEK